MALNAEQEAAAACHLHDSRTSVLIVGGPGSGKTHTLVHRAARLLRAADPARVLLLTFTRAAAAAMTERIERLLPGGVAARVRSGTFHAVAHALLRGHAPAYHIVDEEEKLLLLDQAVRHVFYDMEEQTQGAYRYSQEDRESTVRSMHGVFNALEGAPRPPPSGLQGRVLQKYDEFKHRDGGKDFRDLLVLFRDYIRSPQWPRGAFRHVLIDEVQDLNPLQLEILDALHADGAQLVAIGDDAQAIYGFRGSRVDAILDFERRYAPAAQRVLRRNTATRRRRWPWRRPSSPRTRGAWSAPSPPWWTPPPWRARASSPCRKRRWRRRHPRRDDGAGGARGAAARAVPAPHPVRAGPHAPVPGRGGGGAGGGGRAVQPKARREQEPARPGRAGPAHGGGPAGQGRRRRASAAAQWERLVALAAPDVLCLVTPPCPHAAPHPSEATQPRACAR